MSYTTPIDVLRVGFTGSQNGLTLAQRHNLTGHLVTLFVQGAQFHHGDCIGADEEAALIARGLGYWVVAHPPLDQTKMSKLIWHESREQYEYLLRNHHIVDESNIMFACPRTRQEQLRSGTWATVRYCRKNYIHKICHIIEP